jgi:hypothetical protein
MIPHSTRLPHLLSLVLLTALSASLVVGLVPAAASMGSQQAVAASTVATTWPTLRYGARGSAVVYLQQRLTALRLRLWPHRTTVRVWRRSGSRSNCTTPCSCRILRDVADRIEATPPGRGIGGTLGDTRRHHRRLRAGERRRGMAGDDAGPARHLTGAYRVRPWQVRPWRCRSSLCWFRRSRRSRTGGR